MIVSVKVLSKLANLRKKYAGYDLVVIGANFFTEGGDWRSIYTYVRHQQTDKRKVTLIVLSGIRSWARFAMTVMFSPVILVNCIAALAYWPVLVACLLRSDIRVYLHATTYALNEFCTASRWKYGLLKRILRKNRILCVSRQAESLYARHYGAQNCKIVYECPGNTDRVRFDEDRINILMVGSINHRKGAELYSQVADLAERQAMRWRFHWVGAISTMNPIYLSRNVVWHGWRWSPGEFIQSCDVFFLSSIDDPFPLAFAEAMQDGKRCVAYEGTGAAEAIDGLPACSVFRSYEPESAFEAIQAALHPGDDCLHLISEKGTDLSSIRSFSRRMEEALRKGD